MRIHKIISTGLLLVASSAMAQFQPASKPMLDTSVFDKWPGVSGGGLSDNGGYFSYGVINLPVSSANIIIRSVSGSWRDSVKGNGLCRFSSDSRWGVVEMKGDSICLLRLGSSERRYLGGVISWSLSG